jgi:hypothetical protein
MGGARVIPTAIISTCILELPFTIGTWCGFSTQTQGMLMTKILCAK